MIVRWLDRDEPIQASVLAAALGMTLDRVRAVLGALQGAGIARAVPGGWVRPTDEALIGLLDAVAIDAGTAGFLDRDRRQYELERAAYRRRSGSGRKRERLEWWTSWWGSLSGHDNESRNPVK
jgi:hypothetical protein